MVDEIDTSSSSSSSPLILRWFKVCVDDVEDVSETVAMNNDGRAEL